ncbi:hypothetical protein HMPREF1545_03923 [Oscillibacter sp. KLE 1728]|nr:hypothetical protein HMPREF1545_03923 [Oscillibacter sp. KLE 1728]
MGKELYSPGSTASRSALPHLGQRPVVFTAVPSSSKVDGYFFK